MSIVYTAAGFAARRIWMTRHRRSFIESVRPSKPRLFVDVSAIIRHDARTGIQRAVRAIWSELLQRDGATFEIIPVAASRTHGFRVAPSDFLARNPADRRLGAQISAGSGDVFLGLDLNSHLLPFYETQLASWREAGAEVHIVVYDLLPLQGPQWFNPATVSNYRRWFDVIRSQCDKALCISDHVASELKKELAGAALPRVGRIHMGGDMEASVPTRGIDAEGAAALAHARSHPSLLMVGTVEPRKGYDIALAAFEHLWREWPTSAPDLIIVGQPGWRTEGVQERLKSHPELGRRLFWLAGASDETLSLLYEASAGLFLTSHAEGYGLPLAEAATHGRRILVRDLPVFREHDLPGTSYFSDDRPPQLAEAIRSFVRGPREVASAAPVETWSQSVDRLIEDLEQSSALHAESPCVPRLPSLVG